MSINSLFKMRKLHKVSGFNMHIFPFVYTCCQIDNFLRKQMYT